MTYTKQAIADASGLTRHAIRNYIKRGLIPKAKGYGLAAKYSDEAMLRAVAIGRMRRAGDRIDAIAQHVAGWTNARWKRFVADTDPAPEEEAAPAKEAPLVGDLPRNEDTLQRGHVPGSDRAWSTPGREPILDLALPAGPSFRVVPLLPGLGLLLDTGASPIVQRVAAEICDRYGQR